MNAETVYKITTAVMWICVAMNFWFLIRNIRARKELLRVTREFIERNGELLELRKRLMDDDRTEDCS